MNARVYLVNTGEIRDGREMYERHDAPVPMADYEVLYAAPPEPADPLDFPLPCDVTVGQITIRKGVALRALVLRMNVLYEMAMGKIADELAAGAATEHREGGK